MSLLVLMYHRAQPGRYGNRADLLDAHFAHLARRYRAVLPGDGLAEGMLNVAVTFDDAYHDFYAVVFPLLKRHGLAALLAVAPGVIRERTDASSEERLGIASDAAFANPDAGGFCTWAELGEMVRSGCVRIAAHGHTHVRLDVPTSDLAAEIDEPQRVLEARLGCPVDSFVLPYGRFSAEALRRAQARYRFVFRIGGAINHAWSSRVLYRVDADAMPRPDALFRPEKLLSYHARFFWNRLRGR